MVEPRLTAFGFDCDNSNEEKYRECIKKFTSEHIDIILKDFERIANENKMQNEEFILKIVISDLPFTRKNNLITATNKVNRFEVKRIYFDRISDLYD